ncbi:TRAP transporter small permease subunit, partial [Euryhalocaulis sp.]|uniref:TRAP transporter small permease subunit n=1 Tax=Euryhalocaulis sp. TaxID=2744307 RepID=UPI0025794BF4
MSYDAWTMVGAALGWLGWLTSWILLLPLVAVMFGLDGAFGSSLRSLLARLIRVSERINDGLGWLAKWLAVALVAVVAIVVVQRYVFGVSLTRMQEGATYLHAGLFMLAAGSTLLADGHVRVDLFYSKLSARGKALTDFIGVYLFLYPMCWLMLNMSRDYVARAWRVWEGSPETDGLPLVFALKTLVPVTAFLLAMAGFSLSARAALTLRGRPIEDHEHHEALTGTRTA